MWVVDFIFCLILFLFFSFVLEHPTERKIYQQQGKENISLKPKATGLEEGE